MDIFLFVKPLFCELRRPIKPAPVEGDRRAESVSVAVAAVIETFLWYSCLTSAVKKGC